MRAAIVVVMVVMTGLAGTSVVEVPDPVCVDEHSQEAYAVAEVLWAEARGEPDEGKVMIVATILARSEKYGITVIESTRRGMRRGRLDRKMVEFAQVALKRGAGEYFYWLNPSRCTDLGWLEYANTRNGMKIGRHVFLR